LYYLGRLNAIKNFLLFTDTMHALKYCRSKERWEPRLTDRNNVDTWMQRTGGRDMAQRANEPARKILNEHHPAYVTEYQAKGIDRIAKAAQQYFVETHLGT